MISVIKGAGFLMFRLRVLYEVRITLSGMQTLSVATHTRGGVGYGFTLFTAVTMSATGEHPHYTYWSHTGPGTAPDLLFWSDGLSRPPIIYLIVGGRGARIKYALRNVVFSPKARQEGSFQNVEICGGGAICGEGWGRGPSRHP